MALILQLYLALLFAFCTRSTAFFNQIYLASKYYRNPMIPVSSYSERKPLSQPNIQKEFFTHFFNIPTTTTTTTVAPVLKEGSSCRRSFDNQPGYCIQADECLHAMRDYRVHGVKIDICNRDNNIVVICCPLVEDLVTDSSSKRISAKMCEKYQKNARGTKFYSKMNFSERRCQQAKPLIVGGEVASKSEYPHMAVIGWTQWDGKRKWACGGSLISELFVLTVGHCTELNGVIPDVVRLGAHQLNNTEDTIVDVGIKKIFLHPRYKSSSYYHDIALLKLEREIDFTPHIQPACLWQLPNVNVGKVVAMGWGRTGFMDPMSTILRKVELKIIDQDTCRNTYRVERRLAKGITRGQFCAGHMEGNMDTCQGDSGGPILAELADFNCVKFIIGLTSFGKFCAAANAPAVYTKVHTYLTWIENIVF